MDEGHRLRARDPSRTAGRSREQTDSSGDDEEPPSPALEPASGASGVERAGVGAVAQDIRSAALSFEFGAVIDRFRPSPAPEFRVEVRRPDDLLVFDLLFDNLVLVAGADPHLTRSNAAAAGVLIVELPPQSFGEEAFFQVSNTQVDIEQEVSDAPGYPKKNAPPSASVPPPGTEPVPALPSARIRMAGRSRLAFLMPAAVERLDYTLPAVLEAMRTWPLRLDTTAQPDPEPFRLAVPDPQVGPAIAVLLEQVVASGSWTSLRTDLAQGLETRGARGFAGELAMAAGRVAARAASALLGADGGCVGTALQEALGGEFAAMESKFQLLRFGPAREAGLMALAMASTEALAADAARVAPGQAYLESGIAGLLALMLVPHVPSKSVTALELPYRMMLSPIGTARWTHQDGPVGPPDRVELWHTRLTTAPHDVGPDGASKVRAIWSPDYPFTLEALFPILAGNKPFRMPLDAVDRKMLVQLMAGYNERRASRASYLPRAARADRLHLSALGALLDAEGNWDVRPHRVDLEQWRHLATLGRDHYVRVVYAGRLCPCGHSASLVKVTERKFESIGGTSGGRIAVLRQRFFVVTRELSRTYTGAHHPFKGRNFPFKRVDILTRVTPDLLPPGKGDSKLAGANIYTGGIQERMVFWPMVPSGASGQGIDFQFEVAAWDGDGERVTFSMPLLFVSEIANNEKPAPIRTAYNATNANRRSGSLGGKTLAYAPYQPSDKGDPRLPTTRMTFAAGALKTGVHFTDEPNYYPETEEAEVGIPALQKLLGKSGETVNVLYPGVYKQHGFGEADPSKNPGQVFLQLKSRHRLDFGGGAGDAKSDSLGGLASPQMGIQGLSRVMGPVAAKSAAAPADAASVEAALAKVIGGSFDPTDFFDGAKILGGVALADILEVAAGLAGAEVPKLLSRELPDRIESSFTWDTEIKKSDPLGLIIPSAKQNQPATRLVMSGIVATPLANPADTHYEAVAAINNFKVNLFGFVIIGFEALRFSSRKGQKPDVSVAMLPGDDAVQFGGALEFVNTLRELVPSNGFSDPPALSVTPSGIAASYSLTLPSVEVGIFALSNLSLGAGFSLPFDATPASVRFNFSERHSPFSLTVSLLGGGGFFAIAISTRGVNEIEAALEFGAAVAINLGVASGGVEIKAGVYFHWKESIPDQGLVELTGYVRLHGELSVLGLISASLTFNLQLSYLKEGSKSLVWGEATLVIEVEVLFFSADVSVRCRREFAGSESDPKFIALIPDEDTWTAYCSAFAEEAI